jgi:hypothetical protein
MEENGRSFVVNVTHARAAFRGEEPPNDVKMTLTRSHYHGSLSKGTGF